MKKQTTFFTVLAIIMIGCSDESPKKQGSGISIEDPPKTLFQFDRVYTKCVRPTGLEVTYGINDNFTELLDVGVVLSTSDTPTINDLKFMPDSVDLYGSIVVNGLKSSTTYYLRAFAINEVGTSYSEVVEFNTPATLPSLERGDLYEGGIILGFDCTTVKGVVMAQTDEPGAYSHGLAEDRAKYSTRDGYDDWRLPTLSELDIMYEHFHTQGKGGFTSGGDFEQYWSEKRVYVNEGGVRVEKAYSVDFETGKWRQRHPAYKINVRLVRDF